MGIKPRPQRDPAVVGVDLGGTNFRIAVFRGDSIVAQHKERVGDRRDPQSICDRIGEQVERLAPGGAAVGIGLAAMLRGHDGDVAHSPHLRWRDVAFGDMLRARLPGRRIGIFNDVNAVAYGEYARGAARGSRNVVCVFVGTGIGGGIIADGHLLTGESNTCAELGHMKVVVGDDARPCKCGLRGCVEAYAGGQNLLERIREELDGGPRSLALDLAGSAGALTPGHIDEAARRGDPYASELWHEVAPLLGLAMANICTALNPGCLVIGGGVLSRTPVLRAMAVEACTELVNPPAGADLRIVDATLGDDAGITGAALLVS